jgi:hypothetical protein
MTFFVTVKKTFGVMNARLCKSSAAIGFIFTTPDGEALSWDINLFDTVKPTPFSLPEDLKIEEATSGHLHSIALTTCGRLFTWGKNEDQQLGREGPNSNLPAEVFLPPSSASRVVQVACGGYFCAVRTEDGQVWTWGKDDYAQLGRAANPALPGKVCCSKPPYYLSFPPPFLLLPLPSR